LLNNELLGQKILISMMYEQLVSIRMTRSITLQIRHHTVFICTLASTAKFYNIFARFIS